MAETIQERVKRKRAEAQAKRDAEGRVSIADQNSGAKAPTRPSSAAGTSAPIPTPQDQIQKAPSVDFTKFGLPKDVISTEDPRSKEIFNTLPEYKPPSGPDVTREQILQYDLGYAKQALNVSQAQTAKMRKTTGAEIERQTTADVERQAAESGRILSKQKLNPAWKKLSEAEKKAATQVFDPEKGKFIPRDTPLIPKFIEEETRPAFKKQGFQGKDKKLTVDRVTTRDEQEAREEKQRQDRIDFAEKKQKEGDIRRGKIDPAISGEIRKTAQANKQAEELRGQLEEGRPDSVTPQEWELLTNEEKQAQIKIDQRIKQNLKDFQADRQSIIDSFSPDPATGELAPQDQASLSKKLRDFDDARDQQIQQEKNVMQSFDISVEGRLRGEFGPGAEKNIIRGKMTAQFLEDDSVFEAGLKSKKKRAQTEAEEEAGEFISDSARTQFMQGFEDEWAKTEAGLRGKHASDQSERQESLEIAIGNNADLKALESDLISGNSLKKLQAREKQAFVMEFMSSDTGSPETVVGRAMSAYADSIKFGGTPKDAQTYSEIDELINEERIKAEETGQPFDNSKVLDTAMTKLSGNIKKGRTYMQSRGYLDTDIQTQVENYQRVVLGYTDELIAQDRDTNSLDNVIKRALDGEELSFSEATQVADFEKKYGDPAEMKRLELSGVSKQEAMLRVLQKEKEKKEKPTFFSTQRVADRLRRAATPEELSVIAGELLEGLDPEIYTAVRSDINKAFQIVSEEKGFGESASFEEVEEKVGIVEAPKEEKRSFFGLFGGDETKDETIEEKANALIKKFQ